MAILRLSDGSEARLHIVPSQPKPSFRLAAVWVEHPIGGGWLAAFRILPAPDGSPVVAEVRVFPDHSRREAGSWAAEHGSLLFNVEDLVPAGGLTSRKLRDVKTPGAAMFTRRVMQEFVKGWAGLGTDAAAEFFTPHGLDPESPATRSGPGRKPLDDLTLAEAAEVYVAALGQPGGPIEAVAKAKGIEHSTASGWIGKARDRGLLTSTPKGTAGGALTERAIRLLRNERRKGRKR